MRARSPRRAKSPYNARSPLRPVHADVRERGYRVRDTGPRRVYTAADIGEYGERGGRRGVAAYDSDEDSPYDEVDYPRPPPRWEEDRLDAPYSLEVDEPGGLRTLVEPAAGKLLPGKVGGAARRGKLLPEKRTSPGRRDKLLPARRPESADVVLGAGRRKPRRATAAPRGRSRVGARARRYGSYDDDEEEDYGVEFEDALASLDDLDLERDGIGKRDFFKALERMGLTGTASEKLAVFRRVLTLSTR